MVECWIQSKPFPVERLWAHLNSSKREECEPFRIRIPLPQAELCFDPDGIRDESEALSEYLSRLFGEHGSFMVDGFLNECRKLNGVKKQSFGFIIISVDSVTSDSSYVTIIGGVIPALEPRVSGKS